MLNGKLIILGAAAEPLQVPGIPLILGRRSVMGWPSGTSIDSQDTLNFSLLTGVRAMSEVFPLERAAEAYEPMMSGKARFRAVLTMKENKTMSKKNSKGTPTDLSEDGVEEISSNLRRLLADVFALYVKTKNFHWHISGRHFRDYHLLLDEQSTQIFAVPRAKNERSSMLRKKIILAVLLSLIAGPLMAQEAKVTSLMSEELREFSGKEGLMITVEYAPGGSDPVHRHDAHAFVYVLEGSIVMQVQGGKEVTLTPGQTFYEGPNDVHVVSRNASSTQPAKFLVFFVKDKGAPVLVPVK